MDGLAAVTSITCLNGVDGLGGLFAGGQATVLLPSRKLEACEAVEAVSVLLRRSEDTLTALDLRYFPFCLLFHFSCGQLRNGDFATSGRHRQSDKQTDTQTGSPHPH